MPKNTDIIVTDKRLKFAGEGSSAIAIKDAPKLAEEFLNPESNSLRDDTVGVPMGDRVLVARIAEQTKTVGGLHLPDTGKTPAAFGVVVGVGQGRYNVVGQLIPLRVHVGAVVMFGKFAGTDVMLFGMGAADGNCVILREEEIMLNLMTKEEYDKVKAVADPEIVGVAK